MHRIAFDGYKTVSRHSRIPKDKEVARRQTENEDGKLNSLCLFLAGKHSYGHVISDLVVKLQVPIGVIK